MFPRNVRFGLLLLVVFTPVMVAFALQVAFTAQYGEGVPSITDTGETVLANHGKEIVVSLDVYDEAVLKQYMAGILIVLTMIAAPIALWMTGCVPQIPGESPDAEEQPFLPVGVWGLVVFVVSIISFATLPAVMILLMDGPAPTNSQLRTIVRILLVATSFAALCFLLSAWWRGTLGRRISREPDYRNPDVDFDVLCVRHGVDNPVMACRMQAKTDRRIAYVCLGVCITLGIEYLLCF